MAANVDKLFKKIDLFSDAIRTTKNSVTSLMVFYEIFRSLFFIVNKPGQIFLLETFSNFIKFLLNIVKLI